MKSKLLFIFLLFVFAGCTKSVRIGYKIKNQTTEQITVKYVLFNEPLDTIVEAINSGSTKQLFLHETNGTFVWYQDDLDSITVFNFLSISQGQNMVQMDVKDPSNWQIEKTGKQSGNIILKISEEDF